MITQLSGSDQWYYVPSKSNPVDIASRGLKPSSPLQSIWFKGPEFSYEDFSQYLVDDSYSFNENDVELKKTKTILTSTVDNYLITYFEKRFSNKILFERNTLPFE